MFTLNQDRSISSLHLVLERVHFHELLLKSFTKRGCVECKLYLRREKSMNDPKQVVDRGYNQIAHSYLQLVEAIGMAVRKKYLNLLVNLLSANAQVLVR